MSQKTCICSLLIFSLIKTSKKEKTKHSQTEITEITYLLWQKNVLTPYLRIKLKKEKKGAVR